MGKEVPLKLDGEVIGRAVVHDNGAIDAHVSPTTELGQKVIDKLNRGLISGLSYDPQKDEAEAVIKDS